MPAHPCEHTTDPEPCTWALRTLLQPGRSLLSQAGLGRGTTTGPGRGGLSSSTRTQSWLPRSVQPGSWRLCTHHPPPLARSPEKPPSAVSPESRAPPTPCRPGGAALFTHSHLGAAAPEECGEDNGHICRRHLCPGRQQASMAAHECGFCLACLAGTQALRAVLSQDRGCEQAAGMECPRPAPAPARGREGRGGCGPERPPVRAHANGHAASSPGWPRSLRPRRAWKGGAAREWDLTEGSEGPQVHAAFPQGPRAPSPGTQSPPGDGKTALPPALGGLHRARGGQGEEVGRGPGTTISRLGGQPRSPLDKPSLPPPPLGSAHSLPHPPAPALRSGALLPKAGSIYTRM